MYNDKRVLAYYKGEKMFWLRIYWIGLSFKNINRWPLLFSERYGFRKYLRIGNIVIHYLPKENINE